MALKAATAKNAAIVNTIVAAEILKKKTVSAVAAALETDAATAADTTVVPGTAVLAETMAFVPTGIVSAAVTVEYS